MYKAWSFSVAWLVRFRARPKAQPCLLTIGRTSIGTATWKHGNTSCPVYRAVERLASHYRAAPFERSGLGSMCRAGNISMLK